MCLQTPRPRGQRGTLLPGLGLGQRTRGSSPERSPADCNLNSQVSVSRAGGENEHGRFTKEAFIESRKDTDIVFGVMNLKSKPLGSPLCSMIKGLRSPDPPS